MLKDGALDLRFRLLATSYAVRIGAEDWRGAAEGRCRAKIERGHRAASTVSVERTSAFA